MKTKQKSKKYSLRKRLSILMMLGWLIPITTICIFMIINYKNGIVAKTESIIKDNLKNCTYTVSTKINEAIQISKNISYNKKLETTWWHYMDGILSQANLYAEVKSELNSVFYNDKRFNMSCFYFIDNPDMHYYTNRDPNAYFEYMDLAHKKALEISAMDSSDAHIIIASDKIYIVRNLYTLSYYQKIGTLTIELDKTILFQNIPNESVYNMAIFFNDADSMLIADNLELPKGMERIFETLKNEYSNLSNDTLKQIKQMKYQSFLYESKQKDYHMGTFFIVDIQDIYSELNDLYHIILIIWIVMIPIIVLFLRFIVRNINRPLDRMRRAAKEIRKGGFGIQIEDGYMPNLEFDELNHSFNKMSAELKRLFDYAYKEELASRDAKIMALQSQINPHFLNNTLEMMNWQARMSGDAVVSKMIEALGTLLDHTMDRSNRRLISLFEELRCADAYLYLISMRFGQRLMVEKNIDQSLLYVQVPQLILQPLLENAVVHGVEITKRGKIWINISRKENNILFQIINTGNTMTEEDIIRVQDILTGKSSINDPKQGKHVSLGIRNVNERIQLIFGDEYGLTILPLEEDMDCDTEVSRPRTIATITIPFQE